MERITDEQMREAFKTVPQTGDVEIEGLIVMTESKYNALKNRKGKAARSRLQKQRRDHAAYWLNNLRWALKMNRWCNDIFYSKMASRYARNYAYWKAKAETND